MTLNDIRNKSGLVIFAIGLALLGFLLMDSGESLSTNSQKNRNILLKVNKEEVTFTEFEQELEQNINVKFTNSIGAVNIDESQRANERDLLWDQKVEQILFSEKFDQSGILVGDSEAWDLISGEFTGNQAQLFGYFFRDQSETGEWNQYDPEMIQNWIELGADNPQWFRYKFFRDNTIREREVSKYFNAVKKGLYATKIDAAIHYKDQVESCSGQYIYIPINKQANNTVVTDKEVNNYYKNHKSEFENSPNRSINYFVFNMKASDSDKNNIRKEMLALIQDKKVFNKRANLEEISPGFRNTDNIEGFINQYGDNKYQLTVISKSEYGDLIKDRKIEDDIIQPYFERNLCRMAKIVNSTKDSISIVYLDREVYASDNTLNEIYSTVYDLIQNNNRVEDVEVFAKENNISPRQVILEKMDKSVPGLDTDSRQIIRWAFNDETNLNEPKFFELKDKYIIAVLSLISESDIKAIELVYNEIKSVIKKKKAVDVIFEEVNNLNYIDINKYASHFNVKIKEIDNLTIKTDVFGNEGYQPGIIGAFMGSNSNTSKPIKSENGVFIFNKTVVNAVNYPSNLLSYQKLIKNDYNAKVDLLLVDALKDDKKIIDNRFNFY
ncbi:MAG: hypothetical protein CMP49_04930 [Flavobacteriales bacterium]|jgi:hypothetical protein|nr:hypothetical protein [Flavobacteriales bacterium]|tara:strand:+ start:483 stop:2312 length:1830 start_codon:yes stop_codon:yes gene_type:complete